MTNDEHWYRKCLQYAEFYGVVAAAADDPDPAIPDDLRLTLIRAALARFRAAEAADPA